jgi:hypothetical protein
MFQAGPYLFKQAETDSEFEQVHALNYATFVREIPQHADSGDGRLVDKFHDKNRYFIALRGARVVGMLSLHDQPPFSVADRLPDPGILCEPGTRPVEIRLLAIRPEERHTTVFGGLTWSVMQHILGSGHTHLFISGFEDRQSMYRRLGFEALGPAVGAHGAQFVPMCLTATRMAELHARVARNWARHVEQWPGGGSR